MIIQINVCQVGLHTFLWNMKNNLPHQIRVEDDGFKDDFIRSAPAVFFYGLKVEYGRILSIIKGEKSI